MTTLKSTYTISKLSMGWGRNKSVFFIVLLFVGGCLLFVANSYFNSISSSLRERITIGVYGEIPYVVSFDRKDSIATVVYFDSQKEVNMPGQYGWYKISSINYLGAIEHKQPQIIASMFEQLVGVPVDIVMFPRTGKLLEPSEEKFYPYFMRTRMRQALLFDTYTSSARNIFDRYEMLQILMTQNSQLLLINGDKGQEIYEAEKLDTFLKGYFYQDILLASHAKVILHVTAKQYKAATRFSRLLEGLGQKVHSIEVEEKDTSSCTLRYGAQERDVAKLLRVYMPRGCSLVEVEKKDIIIDMYFDDSFIGIYT
ncbi:MAG: hypothetical protein AAB893_04685 [Patescibacteria group bacterium]